MVLGNVIQESPTNLRDLVGSINTNVILGSKFHKMKRLYREDRVAFVFDCIPLLGKTIANYQCEVFGYFDRGDTRVCVRSPHGAGKTTTAAILTHHTILTSETDCKVVTTASAWRQLEKYLWPEIKKVGKMLDWYTIGRSPYIPRIEMLTQSIRLEDGVIEAFPVASDDHEAIEGAHATRMFYIFDEAKAIPRDSWNAAEGAFSNEGLSGCDIRVLGISTPGEPTGQFYDIHSARIGYEDWTVKHITLQEGIKAGRISAKWAEQRRRQWGDDNSVYLNRVLGEFADSSEEAIVPLSWVRLAVERWHEWDAAGRPTIPGRCTLGVDTARMGADSTVLADRMASVVRKLHKFQKLPTTGTVGNVKRFGVNKKIIIEIDGGLGAGVYDMLKDDSYPSVYAVKTGGKTYKRDKSGTLEFADVRAAMYWNMRELLDPDEGHEICLPDDPDLILDLTTPTYEIMRGIIRLENKKSIKRKLGRSTDSGDAVCLAYWDAGGGGGVVI